MAEAYFVLIISALVISAFYLTWRYAWYPLVTRRFIRTLFTLRDKLFEYANNSELSFESTLYLELREKIHSQIRNHNLLQLHQILFYGIIQQIYAIKKPADAAQIIEKGEDLGYEYSEETKELVHDIETSLNLEVVALIALRNPLLLILSILALTLMVIYFLLKEMDWENPKKILANSFTVKQQGENIRRLTTKEDNLIRKEHGLVY